VKKDISARIAEGMGNLKRHSVPYVIRQDAWQNAYTGLGTSRDKVTQGSYWAPYRLQDSELLALYNGSDIAAKVVETRPRYMMRKGYEIEVDGSAKDGEDVPDAEELADLGKYAQKLRCNELVTDAGVWGGLFGGAILIIGAQDGQPMDKPLVHENIRTVNYLNVIDRRFATVASYYSDQLKPNYGLPETYRITGMVSGMDQSNAQVIVHESRCIRFDGARTDVLTRQQLSGWSWSLMQRAYDQLRAFESGFQAVQNLMTDASQAVFKMQNLISMIASGEKDTLQTRMALVDMSRSVARAVLLDAENEEFERQATTFTGLPDILDRFMMRLSAAVNIPVSILLGRSAAGMNATGDNDFRNFYDDLETEQTDELGPKLAKLYHIFACAQDSIGRSLEFKIKFHPLWTSTAAEEADVRLKTSQADTAYVTMGALTPEEVKQSRWGKGQYSTETVIDSDEAAAQGQDAKMFKSMLNPPPELQAQAPGKQGEQQTGITPMPGPGQDQGAMGQAPIGAGASRFGQSKNPVQVMAKLHDPPEAPPGR